MSTKEIAHTILDQFSEEELGRFVAYYSIIYPIADKKNDNERREAFERMERMCRYVPELDEEKELEEYRKEKFGE